MTHHSIFEVVNENSKQTKWIFEDVTISIFNENIPLYYWQWTLRHSYHQNEAKGNLTETCMQNTLLVVNNKKNSAA